MSFVQGKVAVVTGGVGGIGLAIVKKFLEEGVKGVAIVDVFEETGETVISSLQNQYGDKAIFIKADVSKEEEVRNAFETTIEKFKNLDIVVNNAGIGDLNVTNYEKIVAVNLVGVMHGTYLAMREYLPKYKTSEEAVVLNNASIFGLNPMYLVPTYSATKHGVIGLGKSLEKNEMCLKNNIRVLTICPGLIETPLIKEVMSQPSEFLDAINEMCKKGSPVEYLADAAEEIISKGKNGSVWVAEDEEPPYEVVFLHREEMRKISSSDAK